MSPDFFAFLLQLDKIFALTSYSSFLLLACLFDAVCPADAIFFPQLENWPLDSLADTAMTGFLPSPKRL